MTERSWLGHAGLASAGWTGHTRAVSMFDDVFGREGPEAGAAAEAQVIGRVEAEMAGHPVAEVEAALIRQLRDAGTSYMAPSEIRIIASGIADKDWLKKDPGALERLLAAAETEV